MIVQPWRRKWGVAMPPAYVTYLKQVKQGLRCSRAERKRLLTALKEEILDTFPDADHAALAQIEEEYGPPEIMAQELQEVLPGGAAAAEKKRRRKMRLMLLLGLLAAVLIAGGIIYREHIKAENTPPDESPEIAAAAAAPPVSELPPASVPPEE